MTSRVVLVGLGRISTVHLRALEDIDSVTTVVGVDPGPKVIPSFRREPLCVRADLGDALVAGADLVVVATPTASHAAVVGAVRAWDEDVPILLEKPAADRRDDADRVLSATPAVEVIFHTAFGPEVLWATGFYASETSRLGDVVAFKAWFGGPYADDLENRTESLANSWLDSGINALSVIGRFVLPSAVTSFRSLADHASTFEARLRLGTPDDGTRRHDRHDLAGRRAQPVDPSPFRERGRTRARPHRRRGDPVRGRRRHRALHPGRRRSPPGGALRQLLPRLLRARLLQYPEQAGRDLHGLLFSALKRLDEERMRPGEATCAPVAPPPTGATASQRPAAKDPALPSARAAP